MGNAWPNTSPKLSPEVLAWYKLLAAALPVSRSSITKEYEKKPKTKLDIKIKQPKTIQ